MKSRAGCSGVEEYRDLALFSKDRSVIINKSEDLSLFGLNLVKILIIKHKFTEN